MPIQFKRNDQKAIEAVLWFIQNDEHDMYKIWKMLFSAEKYHINKYGSPITGDRYVAMDYGTVPEWLYDVTKSGNQKIDFYKQGYDLFAKRGPNCDYLSESDVEALKYSLDEYANMDFGAIMKKNHEETAWRKNHIRESSAPIPFEDIIEEDWLKEDLALIASSMVL